MKSTVKKYVIIAVLLCAVIPVFAFDEGFVWGMKANFNGTATLPSINQRDLNTLGAAYMKGSVGYTMDGEAELGYLFGSERWFNHSTDIFSGVSVYGSIGIGNGFTGQVAGNTVEGVTADMFVNINFAPVISFGVGSKTYFLNSKLSLGLWLGSKLIADLSPSYLVYSSHPEVNEKIDKVGEIIVDDFMIKNMNPFSFSTKLFLEYHQPINSNVEMTLSPYMRFNVYTPKYVTMPPQLLELLKVASPNFNTQTPLPSYFLNSLDFGISMGLSFKG